MKKQLIIIVLISNFIWSQETQKKPFKVNPEFYHAFVINVFQGDNYLSKGHKDNSFGGEFKVNLIHLYNFKFGTILEKSTIKVTDIAIGGNSNKTNINSLGGVVSYSLKINNKFYLEPQVNYSGVQLRQKNGSKLFGVQNGSRIGLGLNVKYKLYEKLGLFMNIAYSEYSLKTNTSTEYIDYFNQTKSISYSLGFIIN